MVAWSRDLRPDVIFLVFQARLTLGIWLMNILKYTEAHEAFRKSLADFLAKEVTPCVPQWEEAGIVPKSAWQKMGKAGFLCPWAEKKYGGLGGDFLHSVIVTEELSRTFHTGLAATLHSDVVVPYIAAFGTNDQKNTWLPKCVSGEAVCAIAMTEPGAGSDLAAMETTAVEKDGRVVLDGTKTFISNGVNADLVIVAAKDPKEQNPYQAISLYLVEDGRPGFSRGKRLDKMGWRSQDTAELYFSQCRIPTGNRLGQKGGGFLMLMEKLQQERLVCAMGAVCAAERILEGVMAICRTPMADGKPPVRSQAVRYALVEMTCEVTLGRTFVDKLVADHMEGKNIVAETSMAKYWTTEMAQRTADRALDLAGQQGMLENRPLARAFRDVRVMSIFAGTNEIMKNIAAKFMGM